MNTTVSKVLTRSDRFIYFGGAGPRIPTSLIATDGRSLSKDGIGYYVFDSLTFIADFEAWLTTLGDQGYQSPPFEWISLRE